MDPVNSLDPSDPNWAALLRQNTQSPLAETVNPDDFFHVQTMDNTAPGVSYQNWLGYNQGPTGDGWEQARHAQALANAGNLRKEIRYEHAPGDYVEETILPGEVMLANQYRDYTPIHEAGHTMGGHTEYTDPDSRAATDLQSDHPSIYAMEAFNAPDETSYNAAVANSPYGGWDAATNANLKELGVSGNEYIRELLRSHPSGSFANEEYDQLSAVGRTPSLSREDYVNKRNANSYIQQQIQQLRDKEIY